MSNGESSVLNFSGSSASSGNEKQSETGLDVADVPDRILEALHWVRLLRAEAEGNGLLPGRAAFIGQRVEELLKPVPAILAAAAEQLAEVA